MLYPHSWVDTPIAGRLWIWSCPWGPTNHPRIAEPFFLGKPWVLGGTPWYTNVGQTHMSTQRTNIAAWSNETVAESDGQGGNPVMHRPKTISFWWGDSIM